MSELIAKLNKYSAAQLVAKIEKTTDSAEKDAIISILKKRGRDVSPYEGKTIEQIAADASLDSKQSKEEKKAAKNSTKEPKAPKEKKEKTSKGKNVPYIDEVFKAGDTVKVMNDSTKVPAGTEAVIVDTQFQSENPECKFAVMRVGEGPKFIRVLRHLEKVAN